MKILSALLLSLSSNMDTLSISKYYNKKQILIPRSTILIAALLTTAATFISMAAGRLICIIFRNDICNIFGGVLLGIIGVYSFVEYVRIKRNKEGYDTSYYVEPSCKYKKLLESPALINSDNSNFINAKKAVTLSLALSLNNLDIGFASGITFINIPLMLLFNFIVTIAASYLIYILSNTAALKFISKYEKIISGILLICTGILEVWII